MNPSPQESPAKGTGLPEDGVRQVKHDLRAPLINIQGFSAELREAFDRFTTLISYHRESLPSEFHEGAAKLLNEDVIPCLGFLESAVAQLDQRVDTFAQKLKTQPADQQQGGYSR